MRAAPLAAALVVLGAAAISDAKAMNHLKGSSSPYLLQHADNPVDWYPWGDEAFEKAEREDKPIFLSIGYSTCHWCHVMEHESFENVEIAALMNRSFVAVKVDREQRPDVDKIYMSAANAAGWGGGWPLNLFLTPELKPFFGGTYFPPESRGGRPGLRELLPRIAGLWKTKREAISGDAEKVADLLGRISDVSGRRGAVEAAWLDEAYRSFKEDFDPEQGGFSGRPKFPMPSNQDFLLRYYARTGEKKALEMVLTTLRRMSAGGVYDQVGGGFHRYSVDGMWRVPHYEKMLYDNAQLAVNFLQAYQASKDEELARTAGETLDYVLRDMTGPEGGFYSAEDADSLPPEQRGKAGAHKSEGAFYLWTQKELQILLDDDAELFDYRYGVRPGGNALEDPRHEFAGRNILYLEHTLAETAKKFKLSEGAARVRLDADRKKLLKVRANRPRPGLDDKVLTSWNGLMLSAFAQGAQVLEDRRYLQAAQKAAGFLRDNLYDPQTGRLTHAWRKGKREVDGMADDYAFLAQGLLDLYEADFNPAWLKWALALTDKMEALFGDEKAGGYYMTSIDHDRRLLVRVKESTDNVEPAASSVAALNLLRLAQFTNRKDLRARAEKTIEFLGKQLARSPRSLNQMLAAVDFITARPRQVVIAGPPAHPRTIEMLRAVRARLAPVQVVLSFDEGKRKAALLKWLPFLRGMKAKNGEPRAYVCVNYACELPTSDLTVFRDLLDGKPPK